MLGLRRKRSMEGDDVRIRLNFLYPGITATLLEFRRGVGIIAQHLATKSIHDPTKDGADPPSPKHGHCPIDEVETHEAFELEIAVACPVIGSWNFAIEREKQ